MKLFSSILFLLLSFQGFNQIVIRGATNTQTVETHKGMDEVKQINEINFTRTKEEYPVYIIENTVEGASIQTTKGTIETNILENKTINTTQKNTIVIDLDKAKQQIDSLLNKADTAIVIQELLKPFIEVEKGKKEKLTSIEVKAPITPTPLDTTKVEEVSKSQNESSGIFFEKKNEVTIKTEEVVKAEPAKTISKEVIAEAPVKVEVKTTTVVPVKTQEVVKVEPVKAVSNEVKTTTAISTKVEEVAKTQNENSGIFFESKNAALQEQKNEVSTKTTEVVKAEPTKTISNEVIAETPVKVETEATIVTPTKVEEVVKTQNENSGIFFESKKVEVKEEEVVTPTKTIEIEKVEPTKETVIISETPKPRGNLNNLEAISKSNIDYSKTEVEEPVATLNNTQAIAAPKVETAVSETTEKKKNPKNGSWSASLKFGVPIIIGDVSTKGGYGAGLSIQKAMGHIFSLKFEALALETFGISPTMVNNVYPNYKTRFSDYTLQGVFTLNNLNFYKKEPKVLYHIAVGGGLATQHTWTDSKNMTGDFYDYSTINTNSRKEILKSLNQLLDKKYETSLAKDNNKMSIKNTSILPTLVLGLGIDIKLSEKFDLNLSSRISNHFTDNLDGLKAGTKSDFMSFTALGLTYKFGSKKNKNLLWTNPIYSKSEEINELRKKVENGDLLKDEDKDGVLDIFDQDLNTPAKIAVDTRGVASDLDKDGVPDYLDVEPFTPIGAKVTADGRAIDTDGDGIADIYDLENNTKLGNQVDSRGRTINSNPNNLGGVNDFDMIFFDVNSYAVKQEFYSVLHKVARYIQANPNTEIQITGYTDVTSTEKYNLRLSEKRANAVYSMLVQVFKIAPNSLITNFEGEQNPVIEGLPEIRDPRFEAGYYLNRRVELKILK